MDQPQVAAESLGHIDYKNYTDAYTDWLARLGDTSAAANIQDSLYTTLASRKVLDRVLQEVKTSCDSYKKKSRTA